MLAKHKQSCDSYRLCYESRIWVVCGLRNLVCVYVWGGSPVLNVPLSDCGGSAALLMSGQAGNMARWSLASAWAIQYTLLFYGTVHWWESQRMTALSGTVDQPGCGRRLPQPGQLTEKELLDYHNNNNFGSATETEHNNYEGLFCFPLHWITQKAIKLSTFSSLLNSFTKYSKHGNCH